MRWLRPALIAGLACLSVPAAAQPLHLPEFRQCQSAGPAGVDLLRSTANDPAITFVSTRDAGLIVGKHANLTTYLVRKGSGPLRLWVVFASWDGSGPLLVDEALVLGDKAEPRVTVEGRRFSENLIYEVDPGVLLAAHPQQAWLAFGFHKRDDKGRLSRRGVRKAELDLVRLQQMIAQMPLFEQAPGNCAKPASYIDEAIDPSAYNECRIDSAESDGLSIWYEQGYIKVIWQPHISRYLYLNADQSFPADRFDVLQSQPATLEGQGLLGGAIEVHLIEQAYDLVQKHHLKFNDQGSLAIALSGSWGRTEPIPNGLKTRTAIQTALRKLLREPGDLTVEVFGPDGSVLERSVLPAGTLSSANARLKVRLAELQQAMRDPMANCTPPYPIVVT